MKISYEIYDGSKTVARGTIIAVNALAGRKKIASRIRDHRFVNGMKVIINGQTVVDNTTSTLFRAPVAKKLQTLPERIW